MALFKKISVLFFLGWSVLLNNSQGCSMYKITQEGKTVVGNNEDSWRLTSQIYFAPGKDGKFGVAYVGYSDKKHPDGAINEHGLVFDALTLPHKKQLRLQGVGKEAFMYDDLKKIMRQCKTVDEVYTFLDQYSLQILNGSALFNGGILFFVDKTGKYLSVEADTMIFGNDDRYVLANFSVADTKDLSTIKSQRYCRGVAFLENKTGNSLEFCTALSDTMHVCREKLGDGTLYTTIYDLDKGLIHLYFFHDYSKVATFNLAEEFAKGDHGFSIPELFPDNKEYSRFVAFKTPHNQSVLQGIVFFCMAFFVFIAFYFLVSFIHGLFRREEAPAYNWVKLVLGLLAMLLCYYLYSLMRNQSIFYFSYAESEFSLFQPSLYLPWLLLLLFFPLLKINITIFRNARWKFFSRYLFALSNFTFLLLLVLFAYWGFFNVLN